jgi:hypothetical protein
MRNRRLKFRTPHSAFCILLWFCVASVVSVVSVWAGTIDTAFIEQPWPRQSQRVLEVDKYEVRWRHRLDRKEGLFVGVQFTAPADRQTTWRLAATDYGDVGSMAPGVTAVRYLERTPTRQVIQVDLKVLWKRLQLTFEVEQDPLTAVRFRMVNEALGEYRGVFRLLEPPAGESASTATPVELATWLQPARPVPMRLLMLAERMVFLQGVKQFLKTCEAEQAQLTNR